MGLEAAVAELYTLGIVEIYAHTTHHHRSSIDGCICHRLLNKFQADTNRSIWKLH